jgi:hypothetical protein
LFVAFFLLSGVNFTNTFVLLFLANNVRSFFWQMAFGKWRINLANFTVHIGQILLAQNVGEIERQIFC